MNRFSRIDAEGQKLPDDATEHAVALDNTTGLMWVASETKRMTHAKALEYVKSLNLCGFTDWRLPTVEELFLLADRSKYDPAIDTNAFPKCKSDWYWTGTLYAPSPGDYAWVVSFDGGDSLWGLQSDECFVRAVRAGQ